jgi:hypothetical protein
MLLDFANAIGAQRVEGTCSYIRECHAFIDITGPINAEIAVERVCVDLISNNLIFVFGKNSIHTGRVESVKMLKGGSLWRFLCSNSEGSSLVEVGIIG